MKKQDTKKIDLTPNLFQLTKEEFAVLKSQIVISSWGGMRRATPYAFTEQGVAMLSSILHSKRAIRVNIEIMRAFVKLRKFLASHERGRWFKVNLLFGSPYGSVLRGEGFVAELGREY